MAGLPKVAIAGATGNLGPKVLQELLDSGFHVTVLTRESSTNKIPDHPNQTIKRVDYTSVPSLAVALAGIDAVVTTLALMANVDASKPLVDAAVVAGVSRFIPAEFGSDTSLPANAALPVYKGKAVMREYLEETIVSHLGFSYTAVITGPFFDWGLRNNIMANISEHSATLYNGGNIPFSTTRLSTAAKAVVGVLRNLDETKNEVVRIHDGVITQNKVIAAIKKYDGKEWTTEDKATKDVEAWAYEELKRPDADVMKAMYGLIFASIYANTKDYGSDMTGKTWNERLGIRELSDEELDQVIVDTFKTL